MGKHRKHTKLPLRNNDTFAPNEIAILGSTCNVISELVNRLGESLTDYELAYFDASHSKEEKKLLISNYTFHTSGILKTNQQFQINKFNQRIQFAHYDYVFINGNHFEGAKQILILDDVKEESVKKRLSQLTHIQFIIKKNPQTSIFEFLKEHNPTIENLRCYDLKDTKGIARHIENLIQEKIAPVQGLVLAGGKSQRMGKDKGELQFFGKAQREVAIDLLEKNKLRTYLSVRSEQEINGDRIINDVFLGLGPFGAICSAFQKNPDTAWLVLATDLPFVTEAIIKRLLNERDPSRIATSIKGKNQPFVEPLIAIWEPKSYPVLLSYLAQGYSCPRKVLINSDVKEVTVDDTFIRNINTPDDYSAALNELNE
jgi:molybdopterin-guanine dinucleotide biosynthesis protein A